MKRYHQVTWSLVFIMLLYSNLNTKAQEIISLAGKWSFELDPDSLGYKENWSKKPLSKLIQLPGTTDQAGYGTVTKGSDYGILTRAHKYIGPAWYQKKITIPATWNNKKVNLFLGSVLWESKVYVDGKEVSTLSPLYISHKHPLGRLSKGTHTITICVNNDLVHNIGDKGHGYSEYTQSIWNGIVGRIELQKQEEIAINTVKTYPDASAKKLRLEAFISNSQQKKIPIVLTASLTDKKTGKVVRTQQQSIVAQVGEAKYDILLNQLNGIKTWDEFDPALYQVALQIKNGAAAQWTDIIGFRKLSTNTHKILINDKVSYIRGNLDCVHFPLTGYASTDEKDWERIFQKYKDYGLNTVRFHSWCPPEAAFKVADRMGIYIQAEVLWIDWWMAKSNPARPEMDTKGFPQGLGKNPSADAFVQTEMKRILDTYGNHPSFLFFCIGNELGNSDFDVMEQWVKKVKQEDPRRLYAVSTARKIMPVDDYMVTHNIPGIGGTYAGSLNKTDAGLEKNYSKATIPIIAHEVGQYPVYPEWKEIDKYKGVLKARNLEGFKEVATKNGIVNQDLDFHQSSGALQQLLYKNLIENVLLAPSSAGFQMLSMQDYQGQGEALIGWLDAFWDEKGITDGKTFRQHSNAVVPLVRINSFTFTQSDTIKLSMEVANYFKNDINAKLNWQLTDVSGNVIKSGTASKDSFPQGALTVAGQLNIACNSFSSDAKKYIFRLHLAGTNYTNSWPLYIFPKVPKSIADANIYIAYEWDAKVDSVLKNGGKVLLIANKLGTKNTSKPVSFTPLFWSASFFPGQANETLGSLINTQSDAFKSFPTDNFASWQWYRAGNGAKYFDLSAMPEAFRPLVQPISDFHYNKKLGSIFEAKIGMGKLLVCGYDLAKLDNAYLQQLRYSLINYMEGSAFNPVQALSSEKLKEILAKVPIAENLSLLPDQFNNAIFYINAGNKANSTRNDWNKDLDEVVVNKGFTYELNGVKVYKENEKGAWLAKRTNINIAPPNGIKGYIYLHFTNPTNSKTSGMITLEGRDLAIGEIPATGKWVKIFMMREDTNDGKLNINIAADGNSTIEIDKLVIVPED